MLNPFPILFLAPLAYAILRVVVGYLMIRLGITHLRNRADLKRIFTFRFFPFPTALVWYFGIIEMAIGASLIAGFYTQIAALLLCILSIEHIVMHARLTHPLIPSRIFYTLLAATALTLLITGAGAFAFDLPI